MNQFLKIFLVAYSLFLCGRAIGQESTMIEMEGTVSHFQKDGEALIGADGRRLAHNVVVVTIATPAEFSGTKLQIAVGRLEKDPSKFEEGKEIAFKIPKQDWERLRQAASDEQRDGIVRPQSINSLRLRDVVVLNNP